MVLLEKAKELEVLADVDVCVVGGGTTGVMAAVRAARMGAKVAISLIAVFVPLSAAAAGVFIYLRRRFR